MSCGPKGSEESSILQCSVCGRRKELFELPGRSEKYCLECSADVASSILLTTEIDAATMSGQETEGLAARRGVDSALMMYVGPVAARIFLRERHLTGALHAPRRNGVLHLGFNGLG